MLRIVYRPLLTATDRADEDVAQRGTIMRTVALAVVMVGVSLSAGEPEKGAARGGKPLWAAISVSHPVFDAEVWSGPNSGATVNAENDTPC
jgi:hypothetical protein